MAKDKTMYVCSNCGYESVKWLGKCPQCGEWQSFKEIKVAGETGSSAARNAALSVKQTRQSPFSRQSAVPVRLRDIPLQDEPRIDMHDAELNRVLGGGLVPGSITLLGGEPGIGKSTLTLQTLLKMPEKKILYVSGEESAHQIKMRAERLSPTFPESLLVLCETSLEKIFKHIQDVAPDIVVIDSVQTIATESVDSSPGSISQVRECAAALLRFAKTSGVPVMERPVTMVNGENIPYVGIYDGYDKEFAETFNTNFWFNTHLPKWKLIFTNFIQIIWMQKDKLATDVDVYPEHYMDLDGNIHNYDLTSMTSDPILGTLKRDFLAAKYNENSEPVSLLWNIKATKEGSCTEAYAFSLSRVDAFEVPPKLMATVANCLP